MKERRLKTFCRNSLLLPLSLATFDSLFPEVEIRLHRIWRRMCRIWLTAEVATCPSILH